MSQSNNNSDDPLFIMHIGATYAVRISVLHGSSHGLMALPVHGVVRVRLQGGRGNDAQEVDVSTLSEEIGKWEGFGIWDTSTHAQPLADRPAQQIKADLTFKLRMKVGFVCWLELGRIPCAALSSVVSLVFRSYLASRYCSRTDCKCVLGSVCLQVASLLSLSVVQHLEMAPVLLGVYFLQTAFDA